MEFESNELINLVKALQEEIKGERLNINQLKAELHASKLETTVTLVFYTLSFVSKSRYKTDDAFFFSPPLSYQPRTAHRRT